MIVLSPHLDDAVWSCFSAIVRQPAVVVTICAGIPPEGTGPTQFDRRAGFVDGIEAMRARRAEDNLAAAFVGFQARHLDYLDHGYGGGDLTAGVEEALSDVPAGERVLGPLGLHHPDHIEIAAAFRRLALERDLDAWAYDDLPYARMFPESVSAVDAGEPVVCPAAPNKAAAAELYSSQTINWHREEILGPETLRKLA